MISSETIRTIETLRKSGGYWAERLAAQLRYLVELETAGGLESGGALDRAAEAAAQRLQQDGAVTKECTGQIERMLSDFSEDAKKYTVLCIAHAHIDMNWQWDYAETTAVALDTFRTMLKLMDEYPEFKFSQSQASVYEMAEKYHPALLEKIKRRVWEGRWEVTASTWVEADKNLPCGESMARHILYTKRYLSKLLEISPDALLLDFEPDTFGHSRDVPEILANGGVRYYYHGRGYDGHNVYVWEARSGNSVIAYREPHWYNLEAQPDFMFGVPGFCSANHISVMPMVYGVGDHGGGPTRRDLERILDMAGWPLFPSIRFGTFGELFAELEAARDRLPVVREELNFMFTGCYSSQSRIKMANRIAEARLNEVEVFSALAAAFSGSRHNAELFGESWRKVLFNQFHDILPGSCITESREFALGQFQQVKAAANTQASIAFEAIAGMIDTAFAPEGGRNMESTLSEGAGTGYAVTAHALPQVEWGRGTARLYHFFNPSAHPRHEVAELTIWDWPGDENRLRVRDANGNALRHQLLGKNFGFEADCGFGGHTYLSVLVDVSVPAMGYTTILVDEAEAHRFPAFTYLSERTEHPEQFVLENGAVRAVFDSIDLSLVSFVEKGSGRELIDAARGGGAFRLVQEDTSKGMSSWFTGRHKSIQKLGRDAEVSEVRTGGTLLRQWIKYSLRFASSTMKVTVSLDNGATGLVYDVECDWHERGELGRSVPQLNYRAALADTCARYRYDIPYGTIDRDGMEMDAPGNSFIMGLPEKGGPALMLATNNQYGYRGHDDSLAVTLIRSSCEPDLYPEEGVHRTRILLMPVKDAGGCGPLEAAYDFCHPMPHASGRRQNGTLPPSHSFASVTGEGLMLWAVKPPEECRDGGKLIFRLSQVTGRDASGMIELACGVKKAWRVDINEQPLKDSSDVVVRGSRVEFTAKAYSLNGICVELEGSRHG